MKRKSSSSVSSAKRMRSSAPSTLGSRAIKAVAKAIPGVGSAVAAYDLYKQLRGKPSTKSSGSYRRDYTKGKRVVKYKKQRLTVFDKIINRGFVTRQQCGAILDTNNNVGYLGQSTMPAATVLYTVWAALIKQLLLKASIHIKNEDTIVTDSQYYSSRIELVWRQDDGSNLNNTQFTVTNNSTTFKQLIAAIVAQIESWMLSGTVPNQFLTLRYYVDFSGTFTSLLLQSELDLTNTRVTVKSRSELKFQNRTINTTGNDQDNDVDNVPLDGTFFDYATNGTLFRDYSTGSGSSLVTTDPTYGILCTTVGSKTGTKFYDEVPLKRQIVGCKGVGKTDIGPGKIRSSVIYDSVTLLFTKFMSVISSKDYSTASGAYQQVWLGKTRLHAFQKLVQPANFDVTNTIKIAYEHVQQIGAIVYTKTSIQTAPRVRVTNAVTNVTQPIAP